jgi:glycosyltransferase 2 family protein
MKNMKKILSIVIGFSLSAFFLYLAFSNADMEHILSVYSKVSYWQIGVLCLIVFVEFCFRGLRWWLLLKPCTKATAWTVTKLEIMGLGLNNILPLRLGEVARATLGVKVFNVSIITILATVLVERILDALTVSTLFILSYVLGGGIQWKEKYMVLLLFGITGLLLMGKALSPGGVLNRSVIKFPKILRILKQINIGASALKNYKMAFLIVILGFVIWLVDASGYYWSGKVLLQDGILTYGKSIVLLSAIALAIAVPAMPGYFGPFEFAVKKVLMAWGVSENSALALAVLTHGTWFFFITIIALVILYGYRKDLSGIKNVIKDSMRKQEQSCDV